MMMMINNVLLTDALLNVSFVPLLQTKTRMRIMGKMTYMDVCVVAKPTRSTKTSFKPLLSSALRFRINKGREEVKLIFS